MAVPQLVWVDVEPCGSSPLAADLPNGLPCEVPLSAGAREYKRLSFAAAKGLEQLQRVGADANGAVLAPLTQQANVAALIQRFDVFPPQTAQLR